MLNVSGENLSLTNPLYVYVGAFVDELQRAGIHHAVVCPGSRSTPLAITLASQADIRVWMHVDERSAAFFALGMAKRLGQSVALLCTSGTAAANFLPAVAEARLTHIPLLILTSDRPHELRDNGAPQAIDQNRLYGTHVKWFAEAALPEASNSALRYIRTLASRAAALTLAVPAGPVHLNMPFREPLTPAPSVDQTLPALELRDAVAWEGRPGNTPYTIVSDARLGALAPERIGRLAELISTTPQGLIVVGPQFEPALTLPLLRLASRLGYPILADPLSQLRCGVHDHTLVLACYDAFLRLETFAAHVAPHLVLRFGAMPTAKPLLLYLNRYASTCQQVIIDGQAGWEEPTQLAAEMLHTDPEMLCSVLLEVLNDHTNHVSKNTQNSAWLAKWQLAERTTRQALQAAMQEFHQPFEGRVFSELMTLLPDQASLYVGNSMPVRDLDTFFWGSEQTVRIVGNRGANGIDGVISSSLGFSAASKSTEPTVLVIGDLSFFHDQNGLLAAHLHHLNLVVVLINNDGGGIFSFLPQAAYPEHFEQLFGTPTGLDFQPIVQMYGGYFERAETWEQFRSAVIRGISVGGLHVVEVVTERNRNVQMHRQLWQAVDVALSTHV